IGSRSFSHDSVFIPEEPVHEPSPERTMSQENVSDKVRNLQVGAHPRARTEVARSPLKVLAQVEAEPVDTEPQVMADKSLVFTYKSLLHHCYPY
uniref:Uncharacterized protein n=1 Tax=Esox lucius TaxID=8010 RepID=A0AAY5JXP4_ESOLU